MKIFTFLFDFLCSNSLISVAQKNSSVEKNTNASVNKRKQLLLMPLMVLGFLFTNVNAWGQNFTDNASNYSTWTNGSNQGTGFGTWTLSAGANSGSFLGNPANNSMGTTGIGTNAFGLFATGTVYMNALRPFSNAMEVGDKFTFYWAINFDANGGGKGFDLRSGATNIFNVNNNNSATITTTNGNAFTNYGTSPMLVTLIRTSSTQYSFRMTARDGGADYTTTINSSSQIDRINFYIGNQNNGSGERNMYFNHLTIEKGRYRSKASGAWNSSSTWEVSTDGGSTWSDANSTPSNLNGPITILNNHVVTVSSTITIDQTTINAGGKVTLATSGAITVANGPDTYDLTINGTYQRDATGTTLTPTGAVFCGSGGTYIHNASAGTIPTITWDANSTLQIDANVASDEFTETFGNVTFRNAAGTTMFTGTSALSSTIAGNLNLEGTGSIIMSSQLSANGTLTVNGNVTISGNSIFRIESVVFGSGSYTKKLLVLGNYVQSNGTMDLSTNNSTTMTARFAILEVRGNFSHTGGTLTENADGASPGMTTRVLLSKTSGTQTIESTGQTGLIDFNVAASNAQCVISATKTFTLSSSSTMTIGAGTSATDLLVNGTLRSASTITTTGAVTFSSTGTYEHNLNAGIIPTATWSAGSTCSIIGNTGGTPTGLGQTFHDFTWNSTGMTGACALLGGLTTVNGTLRIISTGSTVRELRLATSNGTAYSGAFGNIDISGGTLTLIGSGTAGSNTSSVIVSGNVILSGSGILEMNGGTNAGSSTLNIAGNLTTSETSVINRSFNAISTIIFNKSSGVQTFTQTAGTISNSINWNVGTGTSTNTVQLGSNVNLGTGIGTFTVLGNATFDAGTNVLSGSAASTFNSGATVITANSLGVNGSITLSGTRTYNAATNYTFNGSSAQVTGASVTSAKNLIQNNSAGLTLDSPVTVSNNLTMTAGNITTTPTNILTLGNSAPASLTWTSGKVVGSMKRWMAAATNSGASSSMFPLGSPTRNAQASIEYTTAPTTAGYLEAKFVASNPTSVVAYPTPLTDQFNYVLNNVVSEGYWEIKPSATSGVAGGTYKVTLEGETISLAASTNASYTDVRVIKSPVPHSSWVLQGAHGTATGANADFTVSRTGMSGYSYFAMAYPTSAPLPVELVSFSANCADNNTVSVNWTTASEHNSDYYTVEKSRDGIAWNILATKAAAGNSTQLIHYSVADVADISGTVYYRLTQVDVDGASKMYDIVSTSCSSEKELALIAYPNPSNGQFTVKIENALGGKYDLAITDMQGKAIEEQSLDLETGTTVVKLNLEGLQPGVYLLQFIQDGNKLQQQKLIIE